jgi:TonB family protein
MSYEKSKWKKVAFGTLCAAMIGLAASSLPAQENRKVISNPTPVYPELARKVHLTGTVKVQVVIGADGKIRDVKVIGGHPLLVDAVQDTLKNWKYAAASGETTTLLQFNFHE